MHRSSKILALILSLFISSAYAQGITPVGGGGSGSGTVTSIATSCGVSGGPITTTGTISGNATPNAQTGVSYAIVNGDCGKLVTLSNAGAVAVSIAQAGTAGSFASGWFATIKNLGVGTVTITPTTSTIDGAANLALTTNQSIDLYSDGTNYITGRGIGGATTDASLLTSGTLAAARLPAFTGDCVTAAGSAATNCVGPHPGFVASNWYIPFGVGGFNTGTAIGANIISCHYGSVLNKLTISQLGARVTTVGTTNTQFAIYANSNGLPSTLIAATGNIANTGTGVITGALSANKQVGPAGTDGGRELWFCTNQNDGSVIYSGLTSANSNMGIYVGSATATQVIANGPITLTGITCSGANCAGGSSTFNTWPATLAGSTWTKLTNTNIPLVIFLVNSVP